MNILSEYKFWRCPILLKLRYLLASIWNKDAICLTYWINANTFLWSPNIKVYNWGDYINMKLAEMISGKRIIPSQYHISKPMVAMVGSILPWAITKDTIIWGSGCLNSKESGWNHIEKPLKVCAVRGPLTRDLLLKCGINCPEIYGDPVLLFPRYYNPSILKTNKIAIIPHISSLLQVSEVAQKLKVKEEDIVVVNPKSFKTWHDFIDQILSCKLVLSSSLHGLIVADAYHVPNVWVSFRENEHPDDNFKFHDYFASVGKQKIKHPIPIAKIDLTKKDTYIVEWTEPKIDLEKLLDVCPIKQRNETC